MRLALLMHDAEIAAALAGQVIRRGRDLLTVLATLPILALFARAWLGELPVERYDIIAGVAAFLIVAGLARALVERLEYHRTEGALAHFAQRRADVAGYLVPMLVAGLTLLLGGVWALGGPTGASVAIGIAGGVAVGLLSPLVMRRMARMQTGFVPLAALSIRPRYRLPLACAVSATAGAACTQLPSANHVDAIVASAYALVVAMLSGRVDAGVVRYIAMVGRSTAELLLRWLPLQLALLVPAAAVLALSQSWLAAGIAAAAALGLPAFTILRLFAYRAFDRILADWIVTIIVGIAIYLAMSLPPLAPLAIILALVWLAMRGRRTRWLIA